MLIFYFILAPQFFYFHKIFNGVNYLIEKLGTYFFQGHVICHEAG